MWHAAVVFYADENITAAKRTQAKKKLTVKYVNGNQTAILKKWFCVCNAKCKICEKNFFHLFIFQLTLKLSLPCTSNANIKRFRGMFSYRMLPHIFELNFFTLQCHPLQVILFQATSARIQFKLSTQRLMQTFRHQYEHIRYAHMCLRIKNTQHISIIRNISGHFWWSTLLSMCEYARLDQ